MPDTSRKRKGTALRVAGPYVSRTGCLTALVLLVFGHNLSADIAPQPPAQRYHQTHLAMGTEFALDLYAPNPQTADHIATEAFDEIDRLEALLSNYRPSSELSRISRRAAAGPVITDPETFRFLERSLFWSRQSNGAFDITVGPLLRAWGFFFHSGRIPSTAELAALRPRLGWQHVELDPAHRVVRFTTHQPLELDPGSIGKGFAVDRVVALLQEQGVTAAFLSAGNSTVYGLGAPPGTAGWPVHIPDPNHSESVVATILLRNTSLSTGACTEKYFLYKGHRYCHIFDPRSMRPVEGMLQTSIINPSATDSDALSTVAFVLDPQASRTLFASLPDSQALLFGESPARPACLAINWPGDPCHRMRSGQPKELHP